MSLTPSSERRMPSWSGTLPSWLSVILLSIVAFMAKGLLEEYHETKLLSIQTDKRVTVLELQTTSFKDSITELRLSQKDILSEVRALNSSLQQRK